MKDLRGQELFSLSLARSLLKPDVNHGNKCLQRDVQAAAVLAAMAVAEPSSAAGLLTDMLAAIGKATQQLASLCSPYGAQRPPLEAPNTVGPGTPRGLGQGAFSDEIKPTIDHINGSALGAAALLVAAARYTCRSRISV